MSEQTEIKPKRKRRTPEEMAAARAANATSTVTEATTEKPPTQGVGVMGFKADVYAADEKKIDWGLLMAQPKFQMYCVELSRRHHGEVELWIGGFVKDKLIEGERVFFDQYCAWHDQKGYWKQEDYFGNLM